MIQGKNMKLFLPSKWLGYLFYILHALKLFSSSLLQICRQILYHAQKELRNIFGFDIVSLSEKEKSSGSGPFTLVNIMDPATIHASNNTLEAEDRGILMIVVSLIFLNRGTIRERELWKRLNDIQIQPFTKVSVPCFASVL